MGLSDLSPREMWDALYAALLVGDLIAKGLMEGPLEVDVDRVRASLVLLQIEHGFPHPSRSVAVDNAMILLRRDGIGNEDGVRALLMSEAEAIL